MPTNLSRRSFLRRASLATAAASAAQLFPLPNVLLAARRSSGSGLRCALIGCGGRGMSHLGTCLGEKLVAIADADDARLKVVRQVVQAKKGRADQIEEFNDYRRLFDKLGKQLDAVFIATPNHHHAPPSMIAMQLGIGVYCEKPLCHDIAEARRLVAMAAKVKSPTQMGNQGHCMKGYRRLCQAVWKGLVGPIRETHSWCDRSNGGAGPRPPALPVPAGLHWDEWIGPAPYREFHTDLHPHEWHGWYDFGNGSLGNMSCHVLDGVYWALKLEHPTSVELEAVNGGSDERYPIGCRIRWDFPARGDMPALKAYWYEGFRPGKGPSRKARKEDAVRRNLQYNLPPLLVRLQKEHPHEVFDTNGTLYVGEKGILYTGTYGGGARIIGESEDDMPDVPNAPSIADDFLRACREGSRETAAGFGYGARLTEMSLLGNLAQYAGANKLVQWDGPDMKVANLYELNAWIDRPYRKGWKV
jgi:predicted dehydrogenase